MESFPVSIPLLTIDDLVVTVTPELLEALANVPRLCILCVVGRSRAGKSTFLNAIVASLTRRGLLANIPVAACERVCQTFVTGPQVQAVTMGLDCCVLRLQSGGAVLLIDGEGVLNCERPYMNILLGLASQCTAHLVLLDQNIDDTLVNSTARLVGSRLVQGDAVVMPQLHFVINQTCRSTETFAQGLDARIAASPDAAALNRAFPPELRDVFRLRSAEEPLDNVPAADVLLTSFGSDVEEWLTTRLQLEAWLQQPFMLGDVVASGPAYGVFMQEMVALTNTNVASGKVIVQPASNLGALIATRCQLAADAAIAAYDAHPSAPKCPNIKGVEDWSIFPQAHTVACAAALTAYDEAVPGLQVWAGYTPQRTRVEQTLETRLNDVRQCHTEQARQRAEEATRAANNAIAAYDNNPASPKCPNITGTEEWNIFPPAHATACDSALIGFDAAVRPMATWQTCTSERARVTNTLGARLSAVQHHYTLERQRKTDDAKRAANSAVVAYDNHHSSPKVASITGNENLTVLTNNHGTARVAALASFDGAVRAMAAWSVCVSERQGVEAVLAGRLATVQQTHTAQAAVRTSERVAQQAAQERQRLEQERQRMERERQQELARQQEAERKRKEEQERALAALKAAEEETRRAEVERQRVFNEEVIRTWDR